MAGRLNWKGVAVTKQVLENVSQGYTEFGLRVETESKKELRKGHGVLTGTLRRSIHLAQPGYIWSGDDVAEGSERGGQSVQPVNDGKKLTLLIGSGLRYALPVHQGHDIKIRGKVYGKQAGYHYIANGLAKVKPELPAILEKYRMKK